MRRIHHPKEIDQLQKVRRENEKLKKENAKLRKELSRIPMDQSDAANYFAIKALKSSKKAADEKKMASFEERWRCHFCGKGHLRPHKFKRRDGLFYFRKCSLEGCGHTTKMQPLIDPIEGLDESKED